MSFTCGGGGRRSVPGFLLLCFLSHVDACTCMCLCVRMCASVLSWSQCWVSSSTTLHIILFSSSHWTGSLRDLLVSASTARLQSCTARPLLFWDLRVCILVSVLAQHRVLSPPSRHPSPYTLISKLSLSLTFYFPATSPPLHQARSLLALSRGTQVLRT